MNTHPQYAALIDIASIQNFIFQSNDLKDNIGASYLIEHKVFDTYMTTELENNHGRKAYSGGGRALLLFDQENHAKQFVDNWTTRLLLQIPGLIAHVALDQFDDNNYDHMLQHLENRLKENRSFYMPKTTIPAHGITAECRKTGLSAEIWNHASEKFISSAAHAKINAAKEAQQDINRKYKAILSDQYCFTNQLDELGQIKNQDSHIAIVHIDGNDMGERFKHIKSLDDAINLSKAIKKAVESSFDILLNYIVAHYDAIMSAIGFDLSFKHTRTWVPICPETKKKIIPVRPIIMGGDDITFVCDARLGLFFANRFIRAFEKQHVTDNQPLSACAGIAIIKTKYPFYRGYILAEQLCHHAKDKRKADRSPCSYMDVHVSTGGISGSLEKIRRKYYSVPQGNLLYRPYKIAPKTDEYSFDLLVDNLKQLTQFPNNKLHALRKVLALSKDAGQKFVQELHYWQKIQQNPPNLPTIPGRNYDKTLFENLITPYFDMIELADFYPVIKESENA